MFGFLYHYSDIDLNMGMYPVFSQVHFKASSPRAPDILPVQFSNITAKL